jgi:hypothetical protein
MQLNNYFEYGIVFKYTVLDQEYSKYCLNGNVFIFLMYV